MRPAEFWKGLGRGTLFLLGSVFLGFVILCFTFFEELNKSHLRPYYDVIVVGSDPEGVAAAVAAARAGARTLLVDKRSVLGGLMTLGWLNSLDMNYGPNGEVLNEGILSEFLRQVEGDSFDVETAIKVWHEMVEREPNIHLLLGVQEVTPLLQRLPPSQQQQGIAEYWRREANTPYFYAPEAEVVGVRIVQAGGGVREVTAGRVIDATQDGDLAAACGVPYTLGQEDMGRGKVRMAVTLVFRLTGVSEQKWQELCAFLNQSPGHYSGATQRSAWGAGAIMAGYRPRQQEVGIRGLNIGRQNDGSLLVNALHVYGVDGLNPADRERARRQAEAELPYIVSYLRANVPGLDQAELAGTAPELYVRETRHIYGLYRLTIDDVLENRDFSDRIAYASYPVDIQATDARFRGTIVGVPGQYAIPLRCLIPQGVENLLVVGRSASYDSLPHGSARVIPVGMATGQAAGVAAVESIRAKVGLHELAMRPELVAEVQAKLAAQGVVLRPLAVFPREMGHWAYEGLRFMRRLGLAFGGYSNDYHLERPLKEKQFINLLSGAVRFSRAKVSMTPSLPSPALAAGSGREAELTLSRCTVILRHWLGPVVAADENTLQRYGIYSEQILQEVKKARGRITTGAGYMIIKNALEKVGFEPPPPPHRDTVAPSCWLNK